MVDSRFQGPNIGRINPAAGFCFRSQPGHFGTKVEQLTLNPMQQAIDVVRQPGRAGQAQNRVQFIDRSADLHDCGIFGCAVTAWQTRVARVAGFRIDFHSQSSTSSFSCPTICMTGRKAL